MFPKVILTFLLLACPTIRMQIYTRDSCKIQYPCKDTCLDCQFDASGVVCRGKTENITNITFIPATVQTAKTVY